ncbi:TetR/AcrR family transcriptional regulator [Rhodocytophaga aerolata]|uniref:TetR/AcrR family transcriptional regulator n=1 Tax=Rhodocytophaga aerolata TaxID=455078 RepID=A0ABT8R8I0_9BACT|nr:TetR/AcrR family transcriptional regulator [Rhodocytophaga aerolata]MDO1448402.1 TetR/AcrR family transcriptional regulator [Rhodocytophaga aerolata]
MDILAEKKKAIFESTLELIKENGFHGTPMSMVAKKACVACGTIYHYFDSKDTLIAELYAYVKKQMADAMFEGDDEQKEFKDRFYHLILSHCRFYIKHPNTLYFIEQYINSPYNNREPVKDNEQFQHRMWDFLKQGIDTGVLKPMNIHLLGILIHSHVVTTAKLYFSQRVKINEEDFPNIVQVIWDGVKNHSD